MEKSPKVTEFLVKAFRLLSRLVLFLLILFLLVAISVQIPFVQTRITKALTDYLSQNTEFQTSISQVRIRWWDAVSLTDVVVYDHHDSLMVDLKEVYIDFSIRGLLDRENPSIDQIKLHQGNVRLLFHPSESYINLAEFIERINNLFPGGERDPTKKSFKFSIDNVHLDKTSLDIINYGAKPVTEGFDFNNLKFRDLIADADDFYAQGPEIGVKLNYMRGEETTSGLVFQQLKTVFTYTPTFMEFDELFLRSNQTEVRDYLKFSYDSVESLSYFNSQVTILARLQETALNIQDLRYFAENLPDYDDRIFLSGEIEGTVDKLASDELLIRFGTQSALFGKFKIDGLPDLDKSFFELSLVNSILTSNDLAPYVSESARKEINKFKTIRFDADFSGYLHHFTTNGRFRTGIGTAIGRLNYQTRASEPTYSGRLELQGFDIGILVEDPEKFQKITMTGNISGTGLTAETALLKVDATIKSAGINGYDYKNITTDATYGKDLFSGKLTVNDPNLKGNMRGVLDLRDGKDSIRLEVKVDTAFLREIKLVDRETFVSGNVNLDTKGITLDNVEGIARFSEVNLSYEGRNLYLDNFFFQSLFTDDFRAIRLNSDLLVAGISGNFKVNQLINDLTELSEDYLNILTNNSLGNRIKTKKEIDPYQIDINLNFIDINPIINLLEPRATISKNTIIEGAFYQTPVNTVFNFFSSVDTVYFNGNFLYDTNFDFNTSKLNEADEVLASLFVLSKKQELSSGLTFNNLAVEAIWDGSSIDFSYEQDQLGTGSYVRVKNDITLFKDHTSIVFQPSELKILDKIWRFDPDNEITVADKSVLFDNLKLFNGDQYLSLNGSVSPNPKDVLGFVIHNVNLDFINTLSIRSYEGKANGTFGLSNLYEVPEILGQLFIEDLHVNGFLIGEIDAATYLENSRVNIELSNTRNGKRVIAIDGYLGSLNDELQLNAKLNEADLSVLEPYISNYVTRIGGTVTGDLAINGTLNFPVVTGSGKLDGGKFLINYLNTFYVVDGNVLFNTNEISFRELVLRDVRGNRARLRGGISHDYFSDFILDISANLENFQVLNTGAKDNDDFYGTAYATGSLNVFGAANNLDLTARATSMPDTKIFIPFGTSNTVAQEEYIKIINVLDTVRVVNIEEEVNQIAINSFRMNFTFDVTPDAYVEIQIDPRTGETIQGKGNGVLAMNIDTQGNFTMTGNYQISEARYNFSLYNLIRKEFIVEPGGRINWYGDPYQGVMDIQAYYQEYVNLQALQSNQNATLDDPMMRRRFPLKVLMNLKGNLLSPDITFSFDFNEFPKEGNLQTYISAFQNRIANDEQEKNRQVFSVIMMRALSPEGQFSGVGNIATSNLSQLLSSQLNNFIAQVDRNLEVDLDLANLDQNALETFQLRVAYTFLDGRLRVSRDGGFTDMRGNADFNSIAGDWQAEYMITEDGRYRMRIYNRNNFNTFTSLSLSPNVATYGVSVSQNIQFNTFGELWSKIRKKENERLRINDTDDFLRYRQEEDQNWNNIHLDNLDKRVNPLDLQMDQPLGPPRKEEKAKNNSAKN